MPKEGENLSQYVQTLTVWDRECYFKKMTLSDGTILIDPYVLTQWKDDMTALPSVEWPEIYTLFIEKPSVYSKEKLSAYKSLDAYNYVLNGHVQDLQYKDVSDEFCVVRAKVLPYLESNKELRLHCKLHLHGWVSNLHLMFSIFTSCVKLL